MKTVSERMIDYQLLKENPVPWSLSIKCISVNSEKQFKYSITVA